MDIRLAPRGRQRGFAGRTVGREVSTPHTRGAGLEARGWGVGERSRGCAGGCGLDGVVAFDGGVGGGGGAPGARGGFGFLAGDEFVDDGFVGLEAAVGVPAEAAGDEVEEGVVFAFEGLLERFRAWTAAFAFRGDCEARFSQGVEEELFARTFFDEVFLGWTEYFHDAGELFLFVFSGEDGVSGEELG